MLKDTHGAFALGKCPYVHLFILKCLPSCLRGCSQKWYNRFPLYLIRLPFASGKRICWNFSSSTQISCMGVPWWRSPLIQKTSKPVKGQNTAGYYDDSKNYGVWKITGCPAFPENWWSHFQYERTVGTYMRCSNGNPVFSEQTRITTKIPWFQHRITKYPWWIMDMAI